MNYTITRNIINGSSVTPFIYSKQSMPETQHKLSYCAKNLGISADTYTEYLIMVKEKPLVAPNNKTLFVTERAHYKVKTLFYEKTEPVIEVNEEKDLKNVIEQIEFQLKKDTGILKERNDAGFYSTSITKEWNTRINEVNNHFKNILWVDQTTQKEYLYSGMFKHYVFKYDAKQKVPVLKFKNHARYGIELYLEFPIIRELNVNGNKSFETIRHRITSDLNNISDSNDLFSYAIRLILSIYLKIKAGYYIKHTPKVRSINFSEVESLHIEKHYLIPTLYAYLEHFHSVNSLTIDVYDAIKSDLNTFIKYLHGLPRKLPIDFTTLEHKVRFLEFNYISAEKYKEHLQTDSDTKTGQVITRTTIKNNFSSLTNLFNRIKKHRTDLQSINYTNPFSGHNIGKSATKTHIIYKPEQTKQVMAILKEKNEEQLHFLIEFIYFTGIRPIEAKRLKIHHLKSINDAEDDLYLPEDITKNGQSRFVPLGEHLLQRINELNITNYSDEDYVFSPNGGIGPKMASKNYFTKTFQKIRLKCDKIGQLHTLYSFRHTFAHNYMLLAKTDTKYEARLNELMQILGHSSSDITKLYLKRCGVNFFKSRGSKGVQHWDDL
jgi:integrase